MRSESFQKKLESKFDSNLKGLLVVFPKAIFSGFYQVVILRKRLARVKTP
jgi:hypothetical protein